MKTRIGFTLLMTVALATTSLLAKTPPFGGSDDVAYGKKLWKKIEAKGLNSTPANLYVGGPPHGQVREVLEGTIDGKRVIVKRNYYGANISLEAVKKDRDKFLKAITVMAKRDKGYDNDNANWFWVKYNKFGNIMTNKKHMKLAGKVAKGKPVGCIACHASASGNDLVFMHNKEANADIVYVK